MPPEPRFTISKIVEVAITELSLAKGDILIVTVPADVSPQQRETFGKELVKHLRAFGHHDVIPLIMTDDVKFSILRKTDVSTAITSEETALVDPPKPLIADS